MASTIVAMVPVAQVTSDGSCEFDLCGPRRERIRLLSKQMRAIESLMTRVAVTQGLQHCQLLPLARQFFDLKSSLPFGDRVRGVPQVHDVVTPPTIKSLATAGPGVHMQCQHSMDLLRKVRIAANGYAIPVNACALYCLLLSHLQDFDRVLQLHLEDEFGDA